MAAPSSPLRSTAQVADFLYRVSYIIGIQTLRYGRWAWRWIVRHIRPIFCAFSAWLRRVIHRLTGEFCQEMRRLAEGFSLAGQRVRQGFATGFGAGLKALFSLPGAAYRRHRRLFYGTVAVLTPLVAAVVLLVTIRYWSQMTFVLSLEYDGEMLGYITDESVYDAAVVLANGRVFNTDNSFEVERVPRMTLTVAQQDDVLDEASLCDRILASSSSNVAQLVGLYVDGDFMGAVSNSRMLQQMLDGILDEYCQEEAEDEYAEFVQETVLMPGLYPLSTQVSVEALRQKLTMIDTPDGHPLLQVAVVRTVVYEEEVDYAYETYEDSSYYIGYRVIRTPGEEGTRRVRAKVWLLDGEEQSRKVIDSEILVEPVNEVTVVGSKKINPNVTQGDGLPTGKFAWPVPCCPSISSYFGYRWGTNHNGIDIANGPVPVYGQDIVASDGGTVVEVNTEGWGGGYGLYVMIDHGGGYCSVYAHCSAILVSEGQKVGQGELIALVGETGEAYGPHLHFEIRINGVPQDPTDYL